jgi:predicted DNA binding protein
MAGIRTELSVDSPSACPVADASAAVEGSMTDVTWTARAGDDVVTEQFTASTSDDPAAGREDIREVFDYGSRAVYEFDRDADYECVCEFVQRTFGPVTSVHARDGTLHVTIHAADMDRLREVVERLRERYDDVSMEYLVQSREADEQPELVPVDLKRLTDRQREVLETAHRMGYFEYPREANATEVAAALDIQPSTLSEHLAAAQSKLLDELLVGES